MMTIEEAIEKYENNAEYERTHGNLQGCLDFRQITEWLTDYKRLKEQEPCEDVISREDALICMTGEYIADITYKLEDIISKHIQRLRSLPPVKPQEQRWIPVSEMLPIIGEDVLICDYDGDMYINYLHRDGKWGYDYSGNKLKNIMAWMPLPKPYEPQESEDNENE